MTNKGEKTVPTVWKTEIIAGLTTFFTMAYIVVVNPAILSASGMPKSDIFFATCVSAAFATALMGIWARYPFALAPGMGINAFFAFTVCGEFGLPWQTALAGVLISGIIFFILSVVGVRKKLVDMVPKGLIRAISAGIGLFIAFIGMQHGGIVIANNATMVSLGDFSNPATVVAVCGLILTAVLVVRQVVGGVLIGIGFTFILAIILGIAKAPTVFFELPSLPTETMGAAVGGLSQIWDIKIVFVVFTMLFLDLFDTMGTVVALGHTTGFIKDNKTFVRADRVFTADAVGTVIGALLGTSTVTTYIESGSGIVAGGRTGKTALVVAALFLLTLFFLPIFAVIPTVATAPALIIVGAIMFSGAGQIEWSKPVEAIPALVTILAMPATYNISAGLGMGFILFVITHLAAKKYTALKLSTYIIAGAFILFFAKGSIEKIVLSLN